MGNSDYIYIEKQGHLIRLKCASGVDFDTLTTVNEWGDIPSYEMDYQWNRLTRRGTLRSFEDRGTAVLGGMVSVTFEPESAPMLGCDRVFYENESRYPDPYSEPRGRVYLSTYRFWTGTWNSETFEWDDRQQVLKVEDCLSVTPADVDGDGENELMVRNRWPEKPYRVYDWADGEVTAFWPDTRSGNGWCAFGNSKKYRAPAGGYASGGRISRAKL